MTGKVGTALVIAALKQNLISGRSKIIIDNGQIIKVSKDLDGNIVEENLIKHWSDWIDYWSVDFDYESKK